MSDEGKDPESPTKPREPKDKASVAEILEFTRHMSVNLTRPYLDHGELLYDEYGLPK